MTETVAAIASRRPPTPPCDVATPQPEYLEPIRYARLQLQSAEGAPDEVIIAAQNENGLGAGATNAPALSLAHGHAYDGRLILFTAIPPDFEANVTQQIVQLRDAGVQAIFFPGND